MPGDGSAESEAALLILSWALFDLHELAVVARAYAKASAKR